MEQSTAAGALTIATFNLENWDEAPDEAPSLKRRIELIRPQLLRLQADVLCLQEVNAQGEASNRKLSALEELLSGTPYADYHRAVTK